MPASKIVKFDICEVSITKYCSINFINLTTSERGLGFDSQVGLCVIGFSIRNFSGVKLNTNLNFLALRG